jgi:hypothetical protein
MPATKRTAPWEPKRVTSTGTSVEYEQADDGTWGYRLTDPSGHVLVDRAGYTSPDTVSQAVNAWLRDHYEPEQRKARAQRAAPILGSGTAQLHQAMLSKADDNEAQAIRLREQADRLEVEAKRLRAAADVLGEDHG